MASSSRLRASSEKVADHPIDNLSAFAQLTTGRMLDRRLAATLGARYDVQFFDYVASPTGPPAPGTVPSTS